MLTIRDIAQKAGVGKSTVSRYLNGGVVSEKTKKKLDVVIKETGYTPNTYAQNLKAKKTNLIGIITPRLDSYSANETLRGIDEELRNQNYQLLISNTYQSTEREIESIHAFVNQKVEGIIFFATILTEKHKEALKSIKVPLIIIGQEVEGAYCIIHDDYNAGVQVGKYATSIGHRNFLFLNVFEKDISVGMNRRAGVVDSINKESGTSIQEVTTTFQIEDAYKKALEVLPTTKASYVVCATDNIALGVLKAAYSLKRNIPEDFSLSGFGGYDITEAVFPTITTVKFSYKKSGIMAAQKIIELVRGEKIQRITKLENKLVIRDSTKEIKEKND